MVIPSSVLVKETGGHGHGIVRNQCLDAIKSLALQPADLIEDWPTQLGLSRLEEDCTAAGIKEQEAGVDETLELLLELGAGVSPSPLAPVPPVMPSKPVLSAVASRKTQQSGEHNVDVSGFSHFASIGLQQAARTI